MEVLVMKLIFTDNASEANLITHAGTFHCDECMATAILMHYYANTTEDINHTVTNNDSITIARVFKVPESHNAIVYDIGLGIYDHHQSGGNGIRENTKLPYASAGLIWRDFGKAVLRNYHCPEEYIDLAHENIDYYLISGIDAQDNGVNVNGDYRQFSISNIVTNLNPTWDEDPKIANERFLNAVDICICALHDEIQHEVSKVKAISIVKNAMDASTNDTIILNRFCPWQEAVLKADTDGRFNYIIYPSNRGAYNVQCIPVKIGSFELRKPLPEEWRGNASAVGIEGCTFVHNSGFLAACKTLEDCLALIDKANNM